MKKYNKEITAVLSASTVDMYSEQVKEFLNQLSLPRIDVLRYSLAVEEILI